MHGQKLRGKYILRTEFASKPNIYGIISPFDILYIFTFLKKSSSNKRVSTEVIIVWVLFAIDFSK